MSDTQLSPAIRRRLLLKIISNKDAKPSDVDDVIRLAASRIVELTHAQSITFYLLDGKSIQFRFVYYSTSLYLNDPEQEAAFEDRRQRLLELVLPLRTGVVGEVIHTMVPKFFSGRVNDESMHDLSRMTGFTVKSMVTVPVVGTKCLGAIQLINKDPESGETAFTVGDLKVLEELANYTGPLVQRSIDPNYRVPEEKLARYIATFTDSTLVLDEAEVVVDEELLQTVGEPMVTETGIFPCQRVGAGGISALMENPYFFNQRERFEEKTGLRLVAVSVVPPRLLEKLKGKYLDSASGKAKASAINDAEISGLLQDIADTLPGRGEAKDLTLLEDEESAPVITIANRIIEDGYAVGASDIHIEPQERDLLIRYRVDGICREKMRLPAPLINTLAARYKVMAHLDISEKRLPQDGRIVFRHFTTKAIDIDLRIATSPTNFGEKVVMRILDKKKSALPITELGFSAYNLARYRTAITQPYGMILHCGPTGSGKSMTLFSALREIATPALNIQTAEDPIEYTIPGINQTQMHKQIGLDFARALRSFLRMDPDVILVGEIRDRETAGISVEAALTGHLLLSTLHTNDAPSTVARLTDMGIEPFMVSSSLLVVCAQRLMRRVCKHCAQEYSPPDDELRIFKEAMPDWTPQPVLRAAEEGCTACGGTGMRGRIGIHELMANSDALTHAINEGQDTAHLKAIAIASGMRTLHQDALEKVHSRDSTLLEALATVPPDRPLR